MFEAEEALFESDASGLGGGDDEAGEVESLGRDHVTSLNPAVGTFFIKSVRHDSARNSRCIPGLFAAPNTARARSGFLAFIAASAIEMIGPRADEPIFSARGTNS